MRHPDELEAGPPRIIKRGQMDTLPSKTLDLLRYLEKNYPDKIQTKELSSYDQGYKHGVIDLIRHLQQLEEGE